MKIRFYCDVYPFSDPGHLQAYTLPFSAKGEGAKRVAFDVEFPDTVIFHTDEKATAAVVQVED